MLHVYWSRQPRVFRRLQSLLFYCAMVAITYMSYSGPHFFYFFTIFFWDIHRIIWVTLCNDMNLEVFIVARLSKGLATLTLGSSKINQHCWRFHGSGVIAAPQIIGLISFCTGMHHEYFFEVANVLSCSPFMFEKNENKQMDWRIRHSHLASTLFHSLVLWWRPWRIRPQITRLSQLENSAMGTWPIYKNSIIPDWFEKWRDIKFWYRC